MQMGRMQVNVVFFCHRSLNDKFCIKMIKPIGILGIIEVLAGEDSIWKSNGSLGTEWNKIKIPLHNQSSEFRVICCLS